MNSDTISDATADPRNCASGAMDGNASFGQWLKHRRRALDLTQHDLAARVGCSAITIRKLESGAKRPSKHLAECLARSLDLAPEQRAAFGQLVRAARGASPADADDSPDVPPFQPTVYQPSPLPALLTALVGRVEECATVQACLLRDEVRLLTLTGPPGVGKTRLSILVADNLSKAGAMPMAFVALAPIQSPELVLPTIAQALGIREDDDQPLPSRMRQHLCAHPMLLVLDNFEHLLAAAPLLSELLAAAPQLKVLTTSREPLHMYGEHLFAVPPLDQCAAVALYIARAQAAQHSVTLMSVNAAAVVELCQRLDGLPLAIELAAARSRLYTTDQILAQLGRRLDLLASGPRDHSPRQQTIRGALDWSYTLLNAAEQQLFAQLGAFVGGVTARTITAVCLGQELRRDDGPSELCHDGAAHAIPPALEALCAKSLVRAELGRDGQPRFGMLETIRAYALERLAERGELPALQQRHGDYYLALAERAYHELRGQQWKIWLEWLAGEYANLCAVLHIAIAQGEGALAVQLTGALVPFWCLHGHPSEGCHWLEAALALDRPAAPLHQARALNGLGLLYRLQGDYARAQQYGEAGLAIRRTIGDQPGIASSIGNLGVLAAEQGRYEEARAYFAEVLLLEQAMGRQWGTVTTLLRLGELECSAGNLAEAQHYLEDSLALSQASGMGQFQVNILANLGQLALEQDDLARAQRRIADGIALSQALGGHVNTVDVIEGLAGVAAAKGRATQAARLLGAAEAFYEARKIRRRLSSRRYYERVVQAVRAQLDDGAFGAAWAAGRTLTLDQASAEALDPG